MSDDHLVTTSEAADLLGVPAKVIISWKLRNRIIPVDWIRGRGRGRQAPIYRLSDLQQPAEEYRQRIAGRPDTPPSAPLSD